MEIEPEGVQSSAGTMTAGKTWPKHYLAAAVLLVIGCALGWNLATLQMYTNWERGIALEANLYYAFVGLLLVLAGSSGLLRSDSHKLRVIAAGVLGLGLGALVQYIQLGTAYIDFWWFTSAPGDMAVLT